MIKRVHKSEIEPFKEWHKGRPKYAVWMYMLDQVEINNLIHKLQKKLSQSIAIYPYSKAHLTVAPAGFPCHKEFFDDDISYSNIAYLGEKIRGLKLQAPNISLRSIKTFPHCPYILCKDLTPTSELCNKFLDKNRKNFTPHISLGVYLESKKTILLKEFFEQEIPQLSFRVNQLICVSFPSHPDKSIPVCPENYTQLENIEFINQS